MCSQAKKEEKFATKPMSTNFNAESTKSKFFCGSCLTKFEIDFEKSRNDRLKSVEDGVS